MERLVAVIEEPAFFFLDAHFAGGSVPKKYHLLESLMFWQPEAKKTLLSLMTCAFWASGESADLKKTRCIPR